MKNINPENITYRYDGNADVLYAFINQPKPAISRDKGNGVVIRFDPETKKAIGFTVVDYMKRKNDGSISTIPHFKNVVLPTY